MTVFTATVISLLANHVCVANMRHLNLGFHLSHITTTSGPGPDRIGTVQIVKSYWTGSVHFLAGPFDL